MQQPRPAIADLVTGLSVADEAMLVRHLPDAFLVLEQDKKLEHAAGQPDAAERSERIIRTYRELLPPELTGIRLSDAEKRALVSSLLVLMESPSPIVVAGAAGALGPTGDLALLPKLADTIREFADTDRDVAATAMRSVSEILASHDPVVLRASPSAANAVEVLRAAGAGRPAGPGSTAEYARNELAWLGQRLEEAFGRSE